MGPGTAVWWASMWVGDVRLSGLASQPKNNGGECCICNVQYSEAYFAVKCFLGSLGKVDCGDILANDI